MEVTGKSTDRGQSLASAQRTTFGNKSKQRLSVLLPQKQNNGKELV